MPISPIRHTHTARQNKADLGATRSRCEAYFDVRRSVSMRSDTGMQSSGALYSYDAKASSGISMTDISSFLMALTAASTSGSTFLMKYFALASLPV